jgi:hypothetical protein
MDMKHLDVWSAAGSNLRLATLEPVSRDIWLAEAERWSRLAQATLLAQTGDERDKEAAALARAMLVSADKDCD